MRCVANTIDQPTSGRRNHGFITSPQAARALARASVRSSSGARKFGRPSDDRTAQQREPDEERQEGAAAEQRHDLAGDIDGDHVAHRAPGADGAVVGAAAASHAHGRRIGHRTNRRERDGAPASTPSRMPQNSWTKNSADGNDATQQRADYDHLPPVARPIGDAPTSMLSTSMMNTGSALMMPICAGVEPLVGEPDAAIDGRRAGGA